MEWPPQTRPHRSNPPDGAVGIVLPIRDDLRFFKLSYHSVLSFTDYRFMLTVVDNMSSLHTVQYLDSIRRNHPINVLQYQKNNSLSSIWNLAVRFMFSFSTVKYAVCMTPTVIAQPYWLSRLVQSLDEGKGYAVPNCNDDCQVIGVRRDIYERLDGFDESMDPVDDFTQRLGEPDRAKMYVHKFELNGFDPKENPQEATHAIRA